MSEPKFSVIIPTRDRAETLAHALQTCLDQSHASFEIIVSDNAGGPAVRSVVEACKSPRVRYLRTPRLLSMSSNWDFAVEQAQGEYVLLIGDDDALLPHALRELDRVTREYKPRVFRWTAAYYSWPNIALAGQGNYLRLPMQRGLREVDSVRAVEEVTAFKACYSTLPMLYNSAIHRDVIADVRRSSGRIFASRIPDVYSGFAFALAVDRYWSTDVPMSISGQSGSSFGVAVVFNANTDARSREFHDLNASEGLRPDARVPNLPIFPYSYVAESFLAAQQFFPRAQGLELDRRQLAERMLSGLRTDTDADWQQALRKIRESLADVPNVQRWFAEKHGNAAFNPAPAIRVRPEHLGYDGVALHLDTSAMGVRDVAGAALLCDSLLNYRHNDVAYEISTLPAPVKPAPSPAAPKVEHVAELQAMELVVERLLCSHLPVGCMIDVGAHHGSTLEPFLHAGWRVHAFEPMDVNRQILNKRFAGSDRLTIHPVAVSDHSGTGFMRVALNLDGSVHDYYHSLETTRADRYHRKGNALSVPLVALDDLAARSVLPEEIGFLKIDTEGHDLAVLRGAGNLRCAAVSLEFWGDKHPLGRSPSPADEVVSLMASRGYGRYLVLSHQGQTTEIYRCDIERIPSSAWGNIVFVHDSRSELYELLSRALPPTPTTFSDEREAELTETMMEDLRVLQQTCDERLKLINELQGEIQTLSLACTERLALIQKLQQMNNNLRLKVERLEQTDLAPGEAGQELPTGHQPAQSEARSTLARAWSWLRPRSGNQR